MLLIFIGLIQKTHNMKKILLTLLLITCTVQAQNGIIGAGFTDGWNLFGEPDNNGDIVFFDAGAGTSRIKTLNPRGTDDQFFRLVRGWDGNKTQFGPFNCVNTDWTNPGQSYGMSVCTDGAFFINCPNTTDNYVFKTPDGSSSTSFVYFRVEGAVRSVSSVTQSPLADNVVVGQDVTVTATLDGTFSTGQGVYIRYTKDSYSTSVVTEMTGSGTTYTTTIPAAYNTANANVSYYIFTSGSGLTISGADADWYTINLNNNGGSNYTYNVEDSWFTAVGATTWSNPASWTIGTVPVDGANVTISKNITLDVDANVSVLSVEDFTTFTTNTGTILSASGTVSNNVSGEILMNGTLQLNPGANVTFSPIFGSDATLVYNNSSNITRGNEWPAANNPPSVVIQNNTILTIADPRSISKNLSVINGGSLRSNGSQTITMNGGSQILNVSGGGVILGVDNGVGNNIRINIANGSNTTLTGTASLMNSDDCKFFIIDVQAGGLLSLSRGIQSKYGSFSVSGSLQINANGFVESGNVDAKPAGFGSASTLIYNNGGNYTSTNYEWPTLNSPFNLTIKNAGTNVTLNGAKTINGTLSLEDGTLTNASNLTMGSGATINRTGGTMTAIPTGTSYNVVYGAHTADITTGFELPSTATVLNDLTISNGNTVTLSDSKVVNGNVNLTVGSFILGENTLNRNTSGGSFTMAADTYLSMAGTQTFPSNYTTHSLNETSTVEYNGTDQSITKLSGDYGHLILSNTGNKTLGTNIVAAGDFSLENDVVSTIDTDNSLTVGGTFSAGVDSDFTVQNNGYLIQTGSGGNANVGSIKVNRVANIKRLDIVLWSSSVDSQNLLDFSSETLVNRFFQYDTALNNWTIISDVANVTMSPTLGYAVRAPNNWSTSISSFSGLFEGVPNSGDYAVAFESSGQRFNLVGNPYPSTLSLRDFYNANNTKIENTFYFYEHTQTPADTNGAVTNYGVLTVGGGGSVYVPATDSPQETNTANIESAESVQVGQGFFVRALTGQSGSLTLNNSMRGGETNSVFFKNNMSTQSETDNRSLFRLRLTNPYGSKNQTVIGCFEDASDEDDIMDSEGIGSAFYSIYQNKKLAIQGRSLPLNQGSVIPLGYKASFTGNYAIDIIEFTGFFQDQHYVILHDLLLGQYHNLSLSPYEFNSELGTIEDRFQIVFTSILSNDGPSMNDGAVVLFEMNDQLHLHIKQGQQINDIKIYDVNGRILFKETPTALSQFSRLDFSKTNNVIIVQVVTSDSKTYTFKTAY